MSEDRKKLKMVSLISVVGVLIFGTCLLSPTANADISVGDVYPGPGSATFSVSRVQECEQGGGSSHWMTQDQYSQDPVDAAIEQSKTLSCTDKQVLQASLTAIHITAGIAQIGLICSGIATPLAITLQGGHVALSMLDLMVNNLECIDRDAQSRNEQYIKQAVCEALTRQGIACDPNGT